MNHYKLYWLSLAATMLFAVGCDESNTSGDTPPDRVDSTPCTDGDWNCDANTLSKCIAGKWESFKTCNPGTTCNIQTASCDPTGTENEDGTCTNGAWNCNDNTLSKCIAGKWEVFKACDTGTTCNEQAASCIDNENPDTQCQASEHLFADRCEPDDVKHCGSHLNDCTKISGWKTGDCIDKACFATECEPNYHLASLVDDGKEKTICERDTKDACGSINTKCGKDEICTDGTCTCAKGKALCQGVCINVLSDASNCGTCGYACGDEEMCSAGKCVARTLCHGIERDTQSDLNHCGECDNRCPDGKICKDGQCTIGYGEAYCGDRIVEMGTIDRCSSCTDRCADGKVCMQGRCTDGFGLAYHNGNVVNIGNDVDHCESYKNRCADGKICKDGQCINGVGKAYCDGVFVDIGTIDRCSSCTDKCADGKICKDGQCIVGTGDAYCGGEIVKLGTIERCANCTDKCADGLMCIDNECKKVSSGSVFCNGNVVNLSNDSANCSKCNNICPANSQCLGGRCHESALSYEFEYEHYYYCNGKSINPTNDSANCGQCGKNVA